MIALFNSISEILPLVMIFKSIVLFISYGYAAISDWKKREINPLIWFPPIIIGILLNILLTKYLIDLNTSVYREIMIKHVQISIIVSIGFIILLSLLSFVFGLIGGADVLALTAFVSMYPHNIELLFVSKKIIIDHVGVVGMLLLLPPILIILLMYLFLVIIPYTISNSIQNIKYINKVKELNIPLWKKLVYMSFCRIVRIKDIIDKRFYYPLYVPGIIERMTFNIDEDDIEWSNKLRNLDPDMTIVVAWGIPMVTFITITIIIYVVFYLVLLMFML